MLITATVDFLVGLDVPEHGNNEIAVSVLFIFDINRTLSRNAVISVTLSVLRYRSVCCSGYSGSPPNCQRKNDHIINNIYCIIMMCCYSNL